MGIDGSRTSTTTSELPKPADAISAIPFLSPISLLDPSPLRATRFKERRFLLFFPPCLLIHAGVPSLISMEY